MATPATPGNTALPTGVSASGANDAWAVGRTQVNKSSFEGLALHWNGTAWSVSQGFPAALSPFGGASAAGVADISPNDAYAIGDSAATAVGSLVHWNGTAWKVVASPNTGSTDGVGAVATKPGAAIVWAVGESGPAGSVNPLVLRNG